MPKVSPLFLILALLLLNMAYSSQALGQQRVPQPTFTFFEKIQLWETALAQFTSEGKHTQYIDTAVRLSSAYQTLGLLSHAHKLLQKAQLRAEQINDQARYATVLSHFGDLDIATGDWQNAQRLLEQAERVARQINSPLLLANIYNKQGNLWMAREDLKDALEPVREKYYQCVISPIEPFSVRRGFSTDRRTFNDMELHCIKTVALKKENYPQCIVLLGLPIKDKILTDNALQCIARAKAIEHYERSLDISAGNQPLTAKVWLNLAQARLKSNEHDQAETAIQTALTHVKALPNNSREKAVGLIRAAQFLRELQMLLKVQATENTFDLLKEPATENTRNQAIHFSPPLPPLEEELFLEEEHHFSQQQIKQFRQQSHQALIQARQIAKTLEDGQLLAEANGYLAQLYADEKRYDDAIQLTRRAIFYAQHQRPYPALLYRWERQLGHLFKKQRNIDAAIAAYQRAIKYLRYIRQAVQKNDRAVVHLELADLLLQKAASARTRTKQQRLLKVVIDNIESLYTAQLQNHSINGCAANLPNRGANREKIPPNTAVLYPIVLPDRLELLVRMPTGIQQKSINMLSGEEQLKYEIAGYRAKLEAASALKNLLPHAQQLYQWLIKPINQILHEYRIETLVIVPGGDLRTVPFAALYDGQQYLIEQYAIAVTPSLRLTDLSRSLGRDNIQALLVGLSEKVPDEFDFPALPHIERELRNIQALIGGKVLKNEQFVIANVERELRRTPYSVVHFATHAHFDNDPNRSFLLAYDGLLNTNRLCKLVGIRQFYHAKLLELLTLSACDTPLGNEKAPLGLAGAGLQAGARSVLASLFSIKDDATAQLMTAFYRHLKNPALSKAQALQKAQQTFLKNPNSLQSHPVYWAPFLLIGNWL